jgi:hypothetical protein
MVFQDRIKVTRTEHNRYISSKESNSSQTLKSFKYTFLPTGVVALGLLEVVPNAIAVMTFTNLGHSSAKAQDVSEDECHLSAKVHTA